MECKFTCFDRIIHNARPLKESVLKEGIEIIQEYDFVDFLDFCVEQNCFTKEQSKVIYCFVVMWEDLKGNYWEEDREKLLSLYDSVGITQDVFDKYSE